MQQNHSCNPHASTLRAWLSAALFLGLAGISHAAALVWEQDSQSFQTEFGDETVEAIYRFTNDGDETVTILETKASCGCTVPTLEKTEYAPGETGELNAVFSIGSRQGDQHKLITVTAQSSSGETEVKELKLNVEIPVPVSFKPRVRFWKTSENAETQIVDVTFHEKSPINLIELESKDPAEGAKFDYAIETVEPGLQYKIKLTPLAPQEKAKAVFFLKGKEDDKGMLKKYPIYAYIR